MAETKKKYRVTLYLGKDLYNKLKPLADFLQVPLSTATRILLTTGIEVSKQLEKEVTQTNERK